MTMPDLALLSSPERRIAAARAISLTGAFVICLLLLPGCASNPNNDVLVDPLKQRLLAREYIALQNLLLSRAPAYGYSDAGSSYLDEPYDGPSIEPPLPDLNLLPEDMPAWDEIPESGGPSAPSEP